MRTPTPASRIHSLVRLLTFPVLLLAGSVQAKPLVNPHASPEAVQVHAYIESLVGKGILSGQQEIPQAGLQDAEELRYIQRATGKLPAILGLDYIEFDQVTERAADWWQRGGLPSICWHWGAPSRGPGYPASQEKIHVETALTPGTDLHAILLADMDKVAEELKKLQASGVPVLWRPFHEFNGEWFWWGKGGPDAFKRLWRLMYERYTHHHGLNNLIWVLGYTAKPESSWYPGDEYVDIAGADTYRPGEHKPMYDALKGIVGERMPLAYHECGPMPDPAKLQAQGISWVWFVTWHTIHLKQQNSPEYLRYVYDHPYVITLDEVPALGRVKKP